MVWKLCFVVLILGLTIVLNVIVDNPKVKITSVSVTKESFLHMNNNSTTTLKVLPLQWEEEIAFKMIRVVKDYGDPFIFDS